MKTCCIIGHRDFETNNEIEIKLKNTIIDLIEKENVTEFFLVVIVISLILATILLANLKISILI